MHTAVKGGGILFLLADLLLYGFKDQRGRKGESLRERTGLLPDLPDTHVHQGTSAETALQRPVGLGSGQRPSGHHSNKAPREGQG